MRQLVTIILMTLFLLPVLGQDSGETPPAKWKSGASTGLSFSQVSLTNWAAGGENSIATSAYASVFANYKMDKSVWDNTLDLAYGLLKQGEESLRKSDDKIDFASKYGYSAGKKWYYSALIGFKSQFTDGYKYPNDSVVISRFLAPAYVLASFGMDYKPNDNFTLYLSPATAKITLVQDEVLSRAGAYGVEPGEKVRSELGGYLKVMFKKPLMENIDLTSKLDLFSSYLDTPQNIDVNWEVLINMRINKFISANISTHLIYDDDIMIAQKDGSAGPRTQFKEVFGLGFSFKF